MDEPRAPLLILVRHAPAETGGRICGRTDAGLRPLDGVDLAPLRCALSGAARRLTSPARRCRETAAALWGGPALPADPRLWEQDFGAWEGRAPEEVPDLGPLTTTELAAHRPPDGESFDDLCARVQPALRELAAAGPVAVVAHAGTVRAGLALAFGAAALSVEVAPLSLTRLRLLPDGGVSVGCVNCVAT